MTDRNIAVVGAGYWGKNLVRNFAELGALHTICDANPTALKAAASRYPDAATQSDYRRVLDDAAVRGVAIATPATHSRQCRTWPDSHTGHTLTTTIST